MRECLRFLRRLFPNQGSPSSDLQKALLLGLTLAACLSALALLGAQADAELAAAEQAAVAVR